MNQKKQSQNSINMIFVDISGIMVSVLTSSALSRGFEPRSGQTKIGICCFSAKHTTLRRKSKDWLARNQNNVSEWSDMSARRLLFQWASTIKIKLSMLVWYKADFIIISLIINLFLPWYSGKIAELALKTTITHSFNNTEFQVSRHMTGNSCHVKLFCMVQAAINLTT
jgi:hypothetical protein